MKHTCPRKECNYVTPDWAAFELHMSKHNYDDAKLLQNDNAALRSEIANYETARQEDARRLEQLKGERDAIKAEAIILSKFFVSIHEIVNEEDLPSSYAYDKIQVIESETCNKLAELKGVE